MVILSNDGWFIDNLWISIVKPFSLHFPGLSMNIYESPIISGASKALWLVQGLGFETFHSAVPFFVLRGPKAALEAVVEAPRRNGRISYSAFVHVYVYIYMFLWHVRVHMLPTADGVDRPLEWCSFEATHMCIYIYVHWYIHRYIRYRKKQEYIYIQLYAILI